MELFSYANQIYDFKNEQLKITAKLGKLNVMCDGSKVMLKLAIQLYNSINNKQNVYDTFVFLDKSNYRLVIESDVSTVEETQINPLYQYVFEDRE